MEKQKIKLKNFLFDLGIINSDGRLWKDQRKFLHERLRKFGMTYSGQGKEQMEGRIMVSVFFFLTFYLFIFSLYLFFKKNKLLNLI